MTTPEQPPVFNSAVSPPTPQNYDEWLHEQKLRTQYYISLGQPISGVLIQTQLLSRLQIIAAGWTIDKQLGCYVKP